MDPLSIEARLSHLERQNRRLRGVVVAGLALGLCAVAQDRSEPLRLISPDGKAEMTLEPDRLVFRRDGKEQVAILADGKVSTFIAFSPDRQAQVLLAPEALGFRLGGKDTVGLLSRGEKQNRGLMLRDARGQPRASVLLSTGGLPLVRLQGSRDTIISQLTIDDDDVQRLAHTRGAGGLSATLRSGADWSGCSAMTAGAEATVSMDSKGQAHTVLINAGGKNADAAP